MKRIQIKTHGGEFIGGLRTVQHWQLYFDDFFIADTSTPHHVEKWRELEKLDEWAAKAREALEKYQISVVDDGGYQEEYNNEDVIKLCEQYDSKVLVNGEDNQKTYTHEEVVSISRNARGYGWEIGRGQSMAEQITASDDNPFTDPDWEAKYGLGELNEDN